METKDHTKAQQVESQKLTEAAIVDTHHKTNEDTNTYQADQWQTQKQKNFKGQATTQQN